MFKKKEKAGPKITTTHEVTLVFKPGELADALGYPGWSEEVYRSPNNIYDDSPPRIQVTLRLKV